MIQPPRLAVVHHVRTATNDHQAEALAQRVRVALDSADADQFADLLDPNVRWGAPDDPNPSCQSRSDVLAWYQRKRLAGRNGRVIDVQAYGDKIVVHLAVSEASAADHAPVEHDRWQVLTCAESGIVDIRGFETSDDALAHLSPGS
jgi:ketosteroid isomerase-like protein